MYQHGKKPRRKSNPKVFTHTVALLGVTLVAVALILSKDVAPITDKHETVPLYTTIGEDEKDTITVKEPLFSLELPSDWVKFQRVQSKVANYYEWRSTKKHADDRRLQLHIDVMPTNHKFTRLLPLTENGNKFMVGNISGVCRDFAVALSGNAPVDAKWSGITFTCDPISINQTVGTASESGSIGTLLSGNSGGSHRYYFFYEDHNISPDNRIFEDALRSFRAI